MTIESKQRLLLDMEAIDMHRSELSDKFNMLTDVEDTAMHNNLVTNFTAMDVMLGFIYALWLYAAEGKITNDDVERISVIAAEMTKHARAQYMDKTDPSTSMTVEAVTEDK